MTEIDVVIPVRNGEATIEYAIRSILWQSLPDFIVWVVDDGSTDDTPRVVERLAEQDSRIRLLQGEGSGISSALNAGIRAGSAPFVARMDADDISLPERFARQVAAFRAHPQIAVLGTRFTYFGEAYGVPPVPISERACAAAVKLFSPFCHPTTMMRRAALETLPELYRSNYDHAEDYDLFSRLLAKYRGANIDEVLLAYRVHGEQISRKKTKEQNKIAHRISVASCANGKDMGTISYLATIAALAARLDTSLWRSWARWFVRMARQSMTAQKRE
jgi:glycosyltransferase involved in cell wall biosynthesis